MKFIIRDDDTCGFTRVEELEDCYKDILPHIPVCLSVTPFRISREGDSFSHNKILYEPYPLDKNPELVSYLKEKISSGQIEAALHGYHHFFKPVSEHHKKLAQNDSRFQNKEYLYGNNLAHKTKEGKGYLEEVLNCKVTTFVPPSNSISINGIKALEINHINLINSFSLLDFNNRPFKIKSLTNFLKKKLWTFKNKIKEYPFVYDFNTYKEISYFSLTPGSDYNRLIKNLKNVSRVNGIFILAAHYQAFHKKIKSGETIIDAMHKLIEAAYKLGSVEFVKYNDIWK